MKKQSVAHGTLYLMFAQMAFVASGYAIHIGLARLLGPSEYGIYSVVISLMTMINLILSKGIPQALSKYVAHSDGNENVVRNKALKLQLFFSFTIFLVYFILAGKIARLLNDADLINFIRISAFIVPGYAMYSLLVGYLNGLREYKKQAVIAISYSIFKVVFIISLVLIGYEVIGAIIGFVLAPLAAILIGLYYKPLKRIEIQQNDKMITFISLKEITNFAVPLIFFSVATNLMINVDLFFVKAYLTNYDVGIYSAASTISKVPFYLIGGLFTALFPAISNTIANNKAEKTCKYISDSVKYSLMMMVPAVLIISIMSENLLKLLYSSEYAQGAPVLSILIIGIGFFSLFSLFATVLNGCGMPNVSLLISIFIITLDLLLNLVLVPRYHLIGAAFATSIASLFGFMMSGLYVYKKMILLTKHS